MFIELNQVSKEVKNRKLLSDVSFQVEKQEIVALEGINGSGKTLILEAVLGLMKVSGTVKVMDHVVRVQDPYPIKAGVMIENPSLIEDFTAYQNLELLRRLEPEVVDSKQIVELLEYFELNRFPKQKVKKFSLGMKQKLGIAQAMLGAHPLIVLDEPTNALDTKSLEKLKALILDYSHRGCTFMIASHDHEFLQSIATKHILVKEGKAIEA
ncbi:ATP-binding cassette domain-containing protein (plasmid) [Lactococcus lactis subsp. lactis]|uniref:ATP-binding cassette domain-containing protein n=1 Tax=Lactococcus lactis TaxID=1358 RepID=UPI002648B5E6|nr:ATP-binding cassette domain-containing protein [Lactococcus lactis]WKB49916.1 ATP-binding cassette domain-containing protein [Lactococcus lactis subsp. lactis]